MEELLRPCDVARLLRVKTRTILNRIARGELPAVKLGGTYRVESAALAAYIESARVRSADAT